MAPLPQKTFHPPETEALSFANMSKQGFSIFTRQSEATDFGSDLHLIKQLRLPSTLHWDVGESRRAAQPISSPLNDIHLRGGPRRQGRSAFTTALLPLPTAAGQTR